MLSSVDRDRLLSWSSGRSGEHRVVCPACSSSRSVANRREPVLSVRIEHDRVVYHCWHCGIQGAIPRGVSREGRRGASVADRGPPSASVVPKRKFLTPELASREVAKVPASSLSPGHVEWLASRGCSEEVALRFRVHTDERSGDIAFPYVFGRKLRNLVQEESSGKKSVRCEGKVNSLFGFDLLDISENKVVHVFEGEIDCLVGASLGLSNCLSVPNGASISADRAPVWLEELKDWLAAERVRAKALDPRSSAPIIKICADVDEAGAALREGLSAHCTAMDLRWIACSDYGGAKDLSEAVMGGFGDVAMDLIMAASEPSLSGVKFASELTEALEDLRTGRTGSGFAPTWRGLAELYSVPLGFMTVVTGYPNMGKSTWLNGLLMGLARDHGLRSVIWSPEFGPETHAASLLEVLLETPFFARSGIKITQSQVEESLPWLSEHFIFLDDENEPPTIESILTRMGQVVDRCGASICVIDPYNNVSKPDKVEQETEWIRRLLVRCRQFARQRNVHVFLVAHPKQQPQSQSDHVPRGESISGGANWRNVADFGITIHRPWDEALGRPSEVTEAHVWKVRFARHGQLGVARLLYQPTYMRFVDVKKYYSAPGESF